MITRPQDMSGGAWPEHRRTTCQPGFATRAIHHAYDPADHHGAITPRTKLVYFETPVNPLSTVLDIAAITARAGAAGVTVAVDSTFASPALQRPIEHGADVVVHSLTKYISGHGDVLGGAVLGRAETIRHMHGHGLRYLTGATISPMAAALVLRGLKTLPLRMERHGSNALAVAAMLEGHPAVRWVSYPQLPSHPGHAVALKQMSGGSGMLAFGLHAGFEGARRLMDRLSLFGRAVSLGDAESLVMHPASLSRARKTIRPEAHLTEGVGEDVIRLSVGLEDVDDLLDDLRHGLAGV